MFKVDAEKLKDPFIKNWYLKVKDKETGPYSYTEVCIMLENEDVARDEEVTLLGHGSWLKLSSCELFAKKQILDFLEDNNIDLDTDIPLRKSIRVPLKAEIAVISGGRMFKGATCDISTSGMMILLKKGNIIPNDEIKLHLYSAPEQKIISLNFQADVIREIPPLKNNHNLNKHSQYSMFGIEFKNTDKDEKENLKSLIRLSIMEGPREVPIEEIFGHRIESLDYGPEFKVA